MPIYEFYCSDCHTLFNFLSRRPNTTKRPRCPRCKRYQLDRQISLFSVSKGLSESGMDESGLPPEMDEAGMERALAEMASQAEGINENDPRQMAAMMRKLFNGTGLNMGAGMEEAIKRMEAGEDPDKIEEEMGDLMETEDPFAVPAKGNLKRLSRQLRPPHVDDELYEL